MIKSYVSGRNRITRIKSFHKLKISTLNNITLSNRPIYDRLKRIQRTMPLGKSQNNSW
jgi:hypothetical protein